MVKDLVECPNCQMSNMMVIDIILGTVGGSFTCTDCGFHYLFKGNTRLERLPSWDIVDGQRRGNGEKEER